MLQYIVVGSQLRENTKKVQSFVDCARCSYQKKASDLNFYKLILLKFHSSQHRVFIKSVKMLVQHAKFIVHY